MSHRLLSSWGELLQFEIRHERKTGQKEDDLFLTCNHFKLSGDKHRIQGSKSKTVRLRHPGSGASNELSNVTIVKCATVSLEPFVLCRPIVLTSFSRSDMNTWFTVHVYAPESTTFAKLCPFSIGGSFHVSEVYVSLEDGPTILCHFQYTVFLAIWNSRSSEFQCAQYGVAFSAPSSILSVFKERPGQFLVLAIAPRNSRDELSELFEDAESYSEDSEANWLLLRANLGGIEVLGTVDQLPCDYATITKEMCLRGSYKDGARFEGNVLLATSLAQLVSVSQDGCIRICELPFDDVASLSTAIVQEHEEVVLACSKTNGVCCVNLKNLVVCMSWPDCVATYCDDFLHVGSDQILLLKSVKDVKCGGFILTDLTRTWPSPQLEVDDKEGEETAPRSMLDAVNALELRLQINAKLLQDLELQRSRKDLVLRKSRLTLDAVTSQTPQKPKREPDLMCIVGNDDNIEARDMDVPAKDYSFPVKIESFWQRIVGRKFIVGVRVLNSGERPISDICLSLVPTSTHAGQPSMTMTTRGRMMYPSSWDSDIHGPDGDTHDHDAAYLAEGEKSWVTVATDCPTFDTAPIFNFDVTLTWKQWSVGNCEGQNSRASRERRQKCILNFGLSFADIEKLTVDLSSAKMVSGHITKVDLLALDCIQLHTELNISTRHTTLRKIASILCNSFSFVQVTMDTTDGLNCDRGCLAGVRLFYRLVNETSMKLAVDTWDRSQLVLFLRALFSVLPYDASVTAVGPNEATKAHMKTVALKHLQNELDEVKRIAEHLEPETAEEFSKRNSTQSVINLRLKSDRAVTRLLDSQAHM